MSWTIVDIFKEILTINPTEDEYGLLANLVISNDLVNQVKLAHAVDQELKDFMKSSANCSLDYEGVIRLNN